MLAPLPLAALLLGMPAAAVAETTPTPSATTSATPSPSATVGATPTTAATPSPAPTTMPSAPATPPPSTSTPGPTATAASPSPTANATPSRAVEAAADPAFSRVAVGSVQEQQADYAAHFLATQLAATGNHLNYPDAGYGVWPDPGNTIDAVLALDATGTGGTAAAAATDWVEANLEEYVEYPGTPISTGGTGKALILADAQGRDPRAFGGYDLVAELRDLVTVEGRFGSSDNDYAVTINQALAIIGLQRAGVTLPAASVDFLAEQQCADGGVRGGIGAATCTSDPDATAFAAQAFLAGGDTARAARALDHLESRQRADGALTNATGEGANANTTGLAAQAFALGGRAPAHLRATSFILGLQWGCDVPSQYRGGIAFSADSRTATTANLEKGIRATPQAVLGLVGGALPTVVADDLAAGTVATPCAASSPTTTPTPTSTPSASASPTTTPTGSGPTGSAPGTPGTDGPAAGPDSPDAQGSGPGLAYTGAEPTLPLVIATLLLLAGAATILVARRRGVHQ
ncbi:hypothetical protein N801_07710 [Knoellia aerolata DSM 18566]|uniref:Gram-positive cocci surface proteins LPxTG domain-containing protein n=1 Tax=Knoellia aerolata DSM 18566 TaxID=1385519 RepID=A0A0A0JW58_9MICO|nr:hypothetical protein N801_07710 [Knoellia aerolata DSM 18566]